MLYLDTSALVKLYLTEAHSADVRKRCDEALFIFTSRLSYVEARSAFARRRREQNLSGVTEEELIDLLNADWQRYRQVDVAESLVHEAGYLAAEYALRAYDAVHLASALQLQERLGRPVAFAAFDASLNRAAKKAGLQLIKG